MNGAFTFKASPPVVGYWVLPPQGKEWKTMFAAYGRPKWFHRKMMSLLLGITWEEKNT